MGMRASGLRERLTEEARALGFSLVGVTGPDASDHMSMYRRWVAQGRHGEMGYLAREDAIERRGDLTATLEEVRSVVVVAHEYYAEDADDLVSDPSRGIIARYARGRDYHRVVKPKLLALLAWLDRVVEGGVRGRAYVDTGPILERELARRAGLGWFGRNTMLIHPRRGSYFFVGVLLVDVDLPRDAPFEADRCGSCRACLDACPTGALLGRDESGAPVMDATRCISYLTIEQRGPIPLELRPLIGNRIYGCDICQEVCPFNARFARVAEEPSYAARGPGQRPVGVQALPAEDLSAGARRRAVAGGGSAETRSRAARAPEHTSAETRSHQAPAPTDVSAETPSAGHPGTEAPSLVDLMRMTPDDWDAFSRGSAIRRAGYSGFKRNVAVAMGNWLSSADDPPREAVAALEDALDNEEPLVHEHAAWALERIASHRASSPVSPRSDGSPADRRRPGCGSRP